MKHMKYKNYNDLMSHTLHQLAAIHSADMVDNKRAFVHLLVDLYFDVDFPDEDIQRREALEEVLTPFLKDTGELAPPPEWKERYQNNAK